MAAAAVGFDAVGNVALVADVDVAVDNRLGLRNTAVAAAAVAGAPQFEDERLGPSL